MLKLQDLTSIISNKRNKAQQYENNLYYELAIEY